MQMVKCKHFAAVSFSCILGRLPNFGSRPNTMDGKFLSVRVSVRPQKSFFDFDEIWYTGSTR